MKLPSGPAGAEAKSLLLPPGTTETCKHTLDLQAAHFSPQVTLSPSEIGP